jgi:hypothetical protein
LKKIRSATCSLDILDPKDLACSHLTGVVPRGSTMISEITSAPMISLFTTTPRVPSMRRRCTQLYAIVDVGPDCACGSRGSHSGTARIQPTLKDVRTPAPARPWLRLHWIFGRGFGGGSVIVGIALAGRFILSCGSGLPRGDRTRFDCG